MEHIDKNFCLEVRGDYACFTRPEMKVERVSYDVITPSAARSLFEAVFWKPAIRWEITRIEVLKPIQWASVRRNEVGAVAGGQPALYIEDHRQQRAGLLLRDVAYRLQATMVYLPPNQRPPAGHLPVELPCDAGETAIRQGPENPAKYHAIFERRARKGQCFCQPYLGCREFSVSSLQWVDGKELAAPIAETRDLGFMLYDLDYQAPGGPRPAFFRAQMESGVILVPPWNSPEVRR